MHNSWPRIVRRARIDRNRYDAALHGAARLLLQNGGGVTRRVSFESRHRPVAAA
jgi:hypothetical protein